MDDDDKELIRTLIDTHSMESIVEVYVEDNCYEPLVKMIMDILAERLDKLTRLEEVFNKK